MQVAYLAEELVVPYGQAFPAGVFEHEIRGCERGRWGIQSRDSSGFNQKVEQNGF